MTPIVIVGEAWGAEEEAARTAFVGWMSRQLNPMLEEAGIDPASIQKTNVFNLRYDGKMETFYGPKNEAIPGFGKCGTGYVHRRFRTEIERLADEIAEWDPNVIIPMGNTPLWAFTGQTGISKFRGTSIISTHTIAGYKLLPTYHPAAIIHQWSLRATAVIDLIKATGESEYPEIRRPHREIWIEPTIEDLEEFYDLYIKGCPILSVDIETSGHWITCIGFAPNSNVALVVPFYDGRRKNRSYWQARDDESRAWGFVREILLDGSIKKLFQNGLYDMAFLWRAYGIKTIGAEHDTMLLHHALQPEALKGLGFLGSIYTDEGAWKQMRGKTKTIKRDE